MQENEQQPLFNVDELNGAWSNLLAQLIMSQLTVQKELSQLKTEYAILKMETERLKAEVSEMKLKVMENEGKQIIDKVRQDY